MNGLIGKKIGITQIITDWGTLTPVTVIQAGPSTVTRLLLKSTDGYEAVQIGFLNAKEKTLNNAQVGDFKKKKMPAKRVLMEFSSSESPDKTYKVGQEVGVDLFEAGDMVDIQGTSKGKGYQGGVKRWHMRGGPDSHGSMFHRKVGSGGASSCPSRTFKGHHMPGRMGGETKTVQNLLVMKVLKDDNLILVRGSVPGHRNGIVRITKSLKRGKVDLSTYASKMQSASSVDEAKKSKKTPKKK